MQADTGPFMVSGAESDYVMGRNGRVHLTIRVDDLSSAVDAALAAGGSLVSAPTAAHRAATRFAYIRDPDGNLIELVSGPASHRDASDHALSGP